MKPRKQFIFAIFSYASKRFRPKKFSIEVKAMKIKKLLSIILSLSMILAISVFPANASSGVITEQGYTSDVNDPNNDTWIRSLQTYEDYDTYGYLSNSADVDWWDIEFSEIGMANFYLQSPSGCNYSMKIYDFDSDSNNVNLIATVTNGGVGGFDLARIHVKPGMYFVKIESTNSSSATNSYLFRAKNYPDRQSYLSTVTYDTSIGTTTPLSNYCKTNINNLGFSTVYDVYNQTASQTFTQLKNSDIHVILSNTNQAGIIKMKMISGIYTYFAGVSHPALNSNSYAISEYNSGDLSETDLIIFAGGKTGATSSAYGNLVDQAMAKGCYCAIGWNGNIDQLSMLIWLNGFLEYSATYSVAYSMIKMDYDAEKRAISTDNSILLEDRYFNSNNAYHMFLNCNY